MLCNALNMALWRGAAQWQLYQITVACTPWHGKGLSTTVILSAVCAIGLAAIWLRHD